MRKNKLPNFVVILILTLITVVMWVSLNIFRALTVKPSPVVPKEVSDPLNPALKTELLNEINSRILIDASQIPETIISQTPSPTPRLNEIPIQGPTPVALPADATESGNAEEQTI